MTMTSPAPTSTIGGSVLANLSTAELYERAIRDAEGTLAADGPLVVLTGDAHRPLAAGQVHRPRAVEPGQGLVGRGQPRDQRGALRRCSARASWRYLKDRSLYAQDMYIGAHEAHRRSLRVYTETAWASIFARNLFRRPPREDLASFAPNFTIIDVPSFEADPATEGTRTGTAILRPPQADGDHHRRHEVRGRDQEVRVHRHELPDARRGRAARCTPRSTSASAGDACIFFGLSGTGKDDALGGPAAQPHRRRRARLGRRATRSTSRAAATPRPSACRRCTSPTSSRPRSASGRSSRTSDIDPRDARARPRLGADHREHPRRVPAPLHRQRRPDGRRPRAPQRRVPDRRRVRRPAADQPAHAASRRPTTSSAATPRSSPAPRSASRSPRQRSRRASARRSCRAIPASTPRCSWTASRRSTSRCGW